MSDEPPRRPGSARALIEARGRSGVAAGQTVVRGGWSGGGRLNPASPDSSSGRKARDEVSGTGKPFAVGELCSTLVMQIASSGQSWQSPCLCLSGQHGMSPDMSAICITALSGTRSPATVGAVKGATANPIEISVANKKRRSRMAVMADCTVPQRRSSIKALRITSLQCSI